MTADELIERAKAQREVENSTELKHLLGRIIWWIEGQLCKECGK
jgi:hypothetical protein